MTSTDSKTWLITGAAGEDAVEGVEPKARLLVAEVDAHRALSTSLAHDDAVVAA